MRMVLRTNAGSFEIELNDNETAMAVYLKLPIEELTNAWGDEIYFPVPVDLPLENGRREMEVGEVAICFFYGRTPVSVDERPMAFSPVTPIGKIVGDPAPLRKVGDRIKVRLERL
jgi:hypothetical protein